MDCSRREVLGLIAASAIAETECAGMEDARSHGGALHPWKPGELKIHLLHTGAGECQFIVFPDGTTMMIDCGDIAAMTRPENAVPVMPDASRLAGEWAARYVLRVNPNQDNVDYLEVSHWHEDHTGSAKWQTIARGWDAGVEGCFRSGFGLAAEFLHFGKAIDRGYPGKIVIRDCTVENADRFLHYNYNNERWQSGAPMRDITFERVTARGIKMPLNAYGQDSKYGYEFCVPLDLTLRDCSISFSAEVPEFIRGANVRLLTLDNVNVKGVTGPLLRTWQGETEVKAHNLKGVGVDVEKGRGIWNAGAI